jgi:hypothetical protein
MKKFLIPLVALSFVVAAAFAAVAWSGRSDDPHEGIIDESAHAVVAPQKLHAAKTVDGGRWSLGTSAGRTPGRVCSTNTVPGAAVASICFDKATMFSDGRDLLAFPGARQISDTKPKLLWDNAWVYGFASPHVASLELVDTTCNVTSLDLDAEGAFLYVASRSEIARGMLPHELVARATDGSVVERRGVDIGLSSNARKAGMKAPAVPASCS